MKTKTKLSDYLRRASTDASLRKRLLYDARFSKKLFGWLALVWALLLLGETVCEGWQWFSKGSCTAWSGLIFTLMLSDKFADRVAMLESMEAQPRR